MAYIKKHKMLMFIIIMAIAAIAMVASIGLFGGDISAETTPMLTWGYAYLDSVPVPHNTVIDVYIGSDLTPSGSCNTTVLGSYGSMMVTGDVSRYGEPLHYIIDGYPSTKIGPDLGIFGLENQDVSLHGYTQGTAPGATHNWTFYGAGFVPKHLPDYFLGTVNLSIVEDVPVEIQGVYYWNNITWLFWHPDAPGTTLVFLEGGLVADYMISSAGACEWEIELQ